MKRILPFLLGLLLSAYVLPWLMMRRQYDLWKPATTCADEDVPPYNYIMTRTDTGHTVTWTWEE
ncbi:MAG TPA: hypothetical protein VI753_16285 [Anaerolineales bacterium]|nr:hypothetical protein [Anaerolineales bacterium]